MPSVGSSVIKCNLAKFRVRAAEVTFYSDLEKGTDIVDVGVNTESSFATTAAQKIIPLWLYRARVPRPK